jgi:hypothetical protein
MRFGRPILLSMGMHKLLRAVVRTDCPQQLPAMAIMG